MRRRFARFGSDRRDGGRRPGNLDTADAEHRGPRGAVPGSARSRASATVTAAAIAVLALASLTVSAGAARAATDAPAPLTRTHIATWAYDDGCNGGAGASSGLVRRWLSYAESDCGTKAHKALVNCHAGRRIFCDVMQYLDPNWQYAVGSIPVAQAASSSWWLHEPAPDQSARIYTSASGGGYLLNQAEASVRRFFRSYVRKQYNSDDGLMMDDQGASMSSELFYATCDCRTTAELNSDRALEAAHRKMSAAMTHRDGAPFLQVDNALAPNPYLPQGFGLLTPSTGVRGLVIEGAPERDGILDPYYSTLLDQIAHVATRTSGFVVTASSAPAGAPYQLQSRRIQEATMLLGYSPGHLVDWAELEQGSRDLAVWPEEGIYPSRPVQSMAVPGGRGCLTGTGHLCSTGGHNSIRVAPGTYRREFRSCSDAGRGFGPCAAIVNTTGAWVPVRRSWLRGSYAHQITMNGGDVQSGGELDLRGAAFEADSTAVGPYDALLLDS